MALLDTTHTVPFILHAVQCKHTTTMRVIKHSAKQVAAPLSHCGHCVCRYHQPVTVEEVIGIFDKCGGTVETSGKDLAVLSEVRTYPFVFM